MMLPLCRYSTDPFIRTPIHLFPSFQSIIICFHSYLRYIYQVYFLHLIPDFKWKVVCPSQKCFVLHWFIQNWFERPAHLFQTSTTFGDGSYQKSPFPTKNSFKIKINLFCKTNLKTPPARKITFRTSRNKGFKSKSHGIYERFFKIRWLCVHGNSIRNPTSRHICKNNILEKFHAKSQSLCDGAGISSWVDNVLG